MGHNHGQEARQSGKSLLTALSLNVGITIAQVVGGVLSGSLSLLADAAHNGSDAATLGISYGAQRVAQRQADPKRTFGYNRAEVIGALINLTTLFVIAAFLSYQAVRRFLDPPEVQGMTMLVVGGIAFIEDALSVWLLYQGAQGSLNIRIAFIHMMGDTLATLGVIVGGLLILLYNIHWIDPVITALIALYVFVHALHEIQKAVRLLMDSAPADFDFDRMVREVEGLPDVQDLHHVHLWQIDEERVALEAHVAVREEDLAKIERIKRHVKEMLLNDFNITHATLEIEIAGQTDHDQSVIRKDE